MSTSSPVPSRLCSINQLPNFRPGDKVRFLGCVNQYNHNSAALLLFHNFPSPASTSTVKIDIRHILDSVHRQHLQVGAWLNILGYITRANSRHSQPEVQAIMIWSAASINLQQYESALLARLDSS